MHWVSFNLHAYWLLHFQRRWRSGPCQAMEWCWRTAAKCRLQPLQPHQTQRPARRRTWAIVARAWLRPRTLCAGCGARAGARPLCTPRRRSFRQLRVAAFWWLTRDVLTLLAMGNLRIKKKWMMLAHLWERATPQSAPSAAGKTRHGGNPDQCRPSPHRRWLRLFCARRSCPTTRRRAEQCSRVNVLGSRVARKVFHSISVCISASRQHTYSTNAGQQLQTTSL